MADYPAPFTSEAACLQRVQDQFKQRLIRALWIGWGTDSVNDVGSDDARDGSWHGATTLGLVEAYPTPGSGPRGGENHQADYASVEADTNMRIKRADGTSWGTGAGPNGFGRQGTYHGAGANRFWTDQTSTGMHAMVKAVGTSARFQVLWDEVVIYDHANSSGNLNWQKIMVGKKTRGVHTMRVIVTAGTVILDHIYNYDGTETSGINTFNGGRSGISLQMVSKTGPGGAPNDEYAAYMPLLSQDGKSGMDIYILTILINNVGDPDTAVLSYYREHITTIKAKNPNVTIFLVRNPQPTNHSEEAWQARWVIIKQIASEFSNIIAVDMSTLNGDTTMIPRFNYAPELVNTLHPTTLLYTGKGLYQGKPIPWGYAPIMLNFLTGAYWATKAPDTGSSNPTTRKPRGIATRGDSLGEQMYPWMPTIKSHFSGLAFFNGAKGGYLSNEAAAFQGGEPAMITFPGGQMPAGTEDVTITVSPNILAWPGQNASAQTDGIAGGVDGWVKMTRVNGVYSYKWARKTAGTAVAVAGAIPFNTGFAYRDLVEIWSLGRNDAGITTPTVMSNRFRNIKKWSLLDPRLHVLFEIPYAAKDTEAAGTVLRAKIDAINARQKLDHPENYLAVVTFLKSDAAFALAGIQKTAQDIADIAAGFLPTSFRIAGDTLHYNQLAYETMTPMIEEHWAKYGFLPTTGTTPTPAVDTAGPTLAYTADSTATGTTIPVGGSRDVFVTATDISGISTGTAVANGQILGSFVLTSTVNVYKFTVTWDMVNKIGASANVVPVFRDKLQNRTELPSRQMLRAEPAAPTDTTTKPVISDVVISGLDKPNARVGIAATVTTSVAGAAITVVPANVGNKFVGKLFPVSAGSNRYFAEFDQSEFTVVGGARTATVTAAASNGTTQTTGAIPYTVAFTSDTTAPTVQMQSPAPFLTLGEQVILRAAAQDIVGVKLVGFATNNYEFVVPAGDAQLILGTAQDGVWEAIIPRSVITAVRADATVLRPYAEDADGNKTWGEHIQISLPQAEENSVDKLWTFLNRQTLDWEEDAVKTAFDQRYAAAVVSELAKGVDATKLTGVLDPARLGLTANGTMPLRNSAGVLIPIAAGGNATVNTLPIRGVGGVLPGVGAGVALTDAANMAQLNAKPNLIIAPAGTISAPLLSKAGDLVVVKGN
jgi:hypothetical protein